MDETTVRGLLELAAASHEPPPSRVDVEVARSRGRRKLLRRRATLAGVSAASVVAAVVVAAVAGPGSGGGTPGRGRAPEAHAPVIAPRQFSLVSPYTAFGWLPPGDSLDAGTITPTGVYLTAGPRSSWALTVFVAGFCNMTSGQVLQQLGQHRRPLLDCSGSSGGLMLPVTSDAPRVDGHTAFWVSHTYLVWQYAGRAWAVLQRPKSAMARTVIKIASGVRYGVAGSPVRFPVQLVNMPAGWTLAYVHFVVDAGVLRASQYGTGPAADSPFLTTDPATAGSSCYPDGQSARQTINGYRVIVNHIPASDGRAAVQQVCAANADGLMVSVSTYGSHASPDAVSIFGRHMRLLGTNPADWTTQPLG